MIEIVDFYIDGMVFFIGNFQQEKGGFVDGRNRMPAAFFPGNVDALLGGPAGAFGLPVDFKWLLTLPLYQGGIVKGNSRE